MGKYWKRVFTGVVLVCAVAFVTGKTADGLPLTPKTFPVEKAEVDRVLQRCETGWSVKNELSVENRQQFILKTSNPQEVKEKLNQYDYNTHTIGSIFIHYGQEHTIEFVPNIDENIDSQKVLEKAAKVCGSLYGYEETQLIADFAVKTGEMEENHKKFGDNYVVVRHNGENATDRWILCIMDEKTYKAKY